MQLLQQQQQQRLSRPTRASRSVVAITAAAKQPSRQIASGRGASASAAAPSATGSQAALAAAAAAAASALLLLGGPLAACAADFGGDDDEGCFGALCTQVGRDTAEAFKARGEAIQSKLAAVDQQFQQSDTLKALLEKSEANKAKNKREIQNKYCARQAELGIGDCGGLRLIPGMTKSGKQRAPQWLQDALQVQEPESNAQGLTLEQLLQRDAAAEAATAAAAAAAGQGEAAAAAVVVGE